jgi:hypothetical protein
MVMAGIVAPSLLTLTAARAQNPTIKGEAALKHPAGQAAVKAAELVAAGKVDEAYALRSNKALAQWKIASADEKDGVRENVKRLNPDPKEFVEAVRKSGELAINENSAVLSAELENGKAVTYFDLEGGIWKVSSGPVFFEDMADPVNEIRVEDAEILQHPIGTLVLQYVDLVHAGTIEVAKRLATTAVQAEWQKEPASEKKESAEFLKKMLPTKANLTALLRSSQSHSVLIIEDGKTATLNLIQNELRPGGSGTTNYTTSTTAIGFAMEGGEWKLAQ